MPEPKPQEEIEELPQDLLKEEEPEEPTNDTKQALEELRQISIQRDMEAAAEERKKILETRDKEGYAEAHQALRPSADVPSLMQREAEERAAEQFTMDNDQAVLAAKKPAKKPWYKRLFGRKE